ncbi:MULTISPECIES: hypothetical protein [Nostoc]|uniref:Uncharacterized protein n=1 Tax=Nostoc paludosum FACHB-159 TaxID=2692908 RepID=A0ABR8KIC4_9NOSO|nr:MULTISPECIES: hypothetical protein [Nostoc]MBD2682490.1 hypothetical protein [Nostoc sp. FACHB-857]MBD2738820.1 hypothetical protein [Nostoc paludosum FACHB-159]
MAKIIDSDLQVIDPELFLQEMTIAQAETVLGGYCQTHEGYPCGYIINITEGMKKPKNPNEDSDQNNISNQKINTIDNSRKIYINGIPIKGKRNITVIC